MYNGQQIYWFGNFNAPPHDFCHLDRTGVPSRVRGDGIPESHLVQLFWQDVQSELSRHGLI
jgi:hypothetical protein